MVNTIYATGTGLGYPAQYKTPRPESSLPKELAIEFVGALKGVGRDEKRIEEVLQNVGKNGLQTSFNEEIRKLRPDTHTALDLLHREYLGNPLEKIFLKAPYKRAENLYWDGKDHYNSSDMHYRLEGIASIPMELFDALTKHPVPTASVFATVAILASLTPFGAAKLSNAITLMSLAGVAQNEWKAAHAPKGSEKRASALRHAGENWIGIGINALPMPEVVNHLKGGTNAIKSGYQGLKANSALESHASHLADDVAKTSSNLVQKVTNFGKELLASFPGFAKVNAEMAMGTGRYILQLPQKIGANGVSEFSKLGNAIKEGFAYESHLPKIASELKSAKNPAEILSTLKNALTAQIPLALTLIDEIMFPFVKILQSIKGGETSYPDK